MDGRRFVDLRAKVADRPVPDFDSGLDDDSDDEFLAALSKVMATADIDRELGATELSRMYRGYAAGITALRNYRPAGHFPGEVVLIRSEKDSITTHAEWAGRCAGVVDVIVPGNHFSMWNEPHVAEVARVIAENLTTDSVR